MAFGPRAVANELALTTSNLLRHSETMARPATKHLTEVELRIMKVLWDRGECSVETLEEELELAGHPLAQSSIRTMLNILGKKEVVRRKQDGRRFLYSAAVEKEDAEGEFLEDIVDRVFEGSTSNLVAALLQRKDLKSNERDRVRELLDAFDQEDEPPSAKR
jgi:predicted transcriptional regulator